jgi:predicted PhzF superfamily epimerase YddE/YHI9
MELPLYQVDAFTDHLFGGNPAGVCPLDRWLPDETMQAIAAENNVAETAFFRREGEAYRLRWFTPTVEVELCGHATLASAYVISQYIEPGCKDMAFDTRSGRLSVARTGDLFVLDFPSRRPATVENPAVGRALGRAPRALLATKQYLAVFDSTAELAALTPDMAALTALDRDGVIATAPGNNGVDYVARFFAPHAGIPEDPATGMAQCTLVPYWAGRLGKKRLTGRQISQRVGDFACELAGERVKIGGKAVCYLKGSIAFDA